VLVSSLPLSDSPIGDILDLCVFSEQHYLLTDFDIPAVSNDVPSVDQSLSEAVRDSAFVVPGGIMDEPSVYLGVIIIEDDIDSQTVAEVSHIDCVEGDMYVNGIKLLHQYIEMADENHQMRPYGVPWDKINILSRVYLVETRCEKDLQNRKRYYSNIRILVERCAALVVHYPTLLDFHVILARRLLTFMLGHVVRERNVYVLRGRRLCSVKKDLMLVYESWLRDSGLSIPDYVYMGKDMGFRLPTMMQIEVKNGTNNAIMRVQRVASLNSVYGSVVCFKSNPPDRLVDWLCHTTSGVYSYIMHVEYISMLKRYVASIMVNNTWYKACADTSHKAVRDVAFLVLQCLQKSGRLCVVCSCCREFRVNNEL